jgi:hypothetical protein
MRACLGVWVKVGTCEALVGLEGLCFIRNGGGAKEEHRIAGRHVLMCVPERHLKMEKELQFSAGWLQPEIRPWRQEVVCRSPSLLA